MEDELVELHVLNEKNIDTLVSPYRILHVVLNNKIDEIDPLIKISTVKTLRHTFQDYENKPIILIACINENVTADTLKSLCQSINSHCKDGVDCFDENWYKWEPLHYVARNADPEKLQVLLDNSVSVNSLTTFSENALHILLEYQQYAKPYHTLLYNGPDSNECLIINTEKKNMLKCAEILIQAGIDINHSNLWNETPICIAVRYGYIQITELLLQISTLDLYNYKEGGVTIRAYLKDNYILRYTLPQYNSLYEDPVKILFSYLKSGDEEAFVEYNYRNIKEYANGMDGETGNMLQFCFKKGYLKYLQHELYNEELTESHIMDNNLMLKVFCSEGLGRCIEHLLNNRADPKSTSRKFPQTLLEAAAVVGYYPLVAMLLQHNLCEFISDEIFEILPKLFDIHYNLINHKYYRKFVLSLLLNKLLSLSLNEVLSSKKLGILNNVLNKLNLECDDDKEDDSENICKILKLGASLTRKVEERNRMIIQCIHPEILGVHFDDCIENNLLYYNSVIEDDSTSYSETRALEFLANDNEKSELLRHPLLIHYIHNKWIRFYHFFYADLFLYFIFLISIYAYIISSHNIHANIIINILFYILLITQSVKECIQLLFLYRFKYFLHTTNYLEMTIILCSFINIFYYNEYCAVIAILFSTVIFVTLLGQVPVCAKYTIIFGSTKYFLQYAGFYFIQFVSFALVFYIIFPFKASTENMSQGNSTNVDALEKDISGTFGDLLKSLFYTLVLFTGQFDDMVLEPERFPIFGRVIMTTFIFCMTIILNNLLVGLIVADMDEMQKAGKLYEQVKIARFVCRMNTIVERLYAFKSNNFIKYIINSLHVFTKGENKVLDLNNCKHKSVFDEQDLKYVKSIRSTKSIGYNHDELKNVYGLLQENKFKH